MVRSCIKVLDLDVQQLLIVLSGKKKQEFELGNRMRIIKISEVILIPFFKGPNYFDAFVLDDNVGNSGHALFNQP